MIAAVVLLGIALQVPAPAQPPSPLPGLLVGMASPSWREREKAFYALLALGGAHATPPVALERLARAYPREFEHVPGAIIASLQRADNLQAQYQREGKHFRSEEFGDYVATLIWATGALRDPRSLPALLPQINSGEGASQALAALGEASLPDLFRLAAESHSATGATAWLTGVSATATLADMAEPTDRARLRPASVKKLRSVLLGAAQSADRPLRFWGIRGLGALGDPSLVPLLEQIDRKYPNTRGEVRAALARIRAAGRSK